jgi:hypothetical protein
MDYLSLMRPKTGTIISISTTPSGYVLQDSGVVQRPPDGKERAIVPAPIRFTLNMLDGIRRARAYYWKVNYSYLFLEPNGEDLDSLTRFIEEGKLRPVVGSETHVKNLDAVKNACQMAYDGKGGIGKAVILFD